MKLSSWPYFWSLELPSITQLCWWIDWYFNELLLRIMYICTFNWGLLKASKVAYSLKWVKNWLQHAFSKNLFYWSIVDLPCCVNFCCTAKCQLYIYILFFIFFSLWFITWYWIQVPVQHALICLNNTYCFTHTISKSVALIILNFLHRSFIFTHIA